MNTKATVDAVAAARKPWPVVVVGAGPAGAFAAYELARSGVRVLLIDRQSFPRSKVCGGCLNARTLSLLAASGLGDLPASVGGVKLSHFELWHRGRAVRLPMPRGIALSRATFDAALVSRAIAAGADFLPATRAILSSASSTARRIRLEPAGLELEARVVLAADGLGGTFLSATSDKRYSPIPDADSRIGAGAVLERHSGSYRPGTIHMAVAPMGYVGVAAVESGRLAVAAALDRKALAGDGVAGAVAAVLARAGLPELGDSGTRWRGTPELSRRSATVAFDRVFLIGDAAGYVEPFTGEGISWALEAAREVSTLAVVGARGARGARADSLPALQEQWQRRYAQRIARRQTWCRGLAWALRRPRLVGAAARILGRSPKLAAPVMAHVNATPVLGKPGIKSVVGPS